jgi:hypothetical protein
MKYGLPEAFHLLQNPPKKMEWKTMVDKKVNQFWIDFLVEDKNSKSSLNLMSVNTCKIGQCHPVWKTVRPNPIDVEKAAIKARILTGTYTLQSNRAKFNQHDVDPTCLLCKEGPENRQHFIFTCKITEPARKKFLTKIIDTVQSSKLDVDVSNLPTLLQLVVDCSGIIGVNPQYEILRKNIEIFSRELVYSIHICHSRLLGAMHKARSG